MEKTPLKAGLRVYAVEMPGIEPGSEKAFLKTSTSLACLFSSETSKPSLNHLSFGLASPPVFGL